MIVGISLTSIDFFARTPSRILDPSRVSVTNSETLIFDIGVDLEVTEPDVLNEKLVKLADDFPCGSTGVCFDK